jgi:hypothetical protein
MIVLDENIGEDQRQLLRSWRIRTYQIGHEVGRQGMKDEPQVIPLLHRLRRATFFTRDLGFYDRSLCHDRYCIVCLAVNQDEAASFIRRFLRHDDFDSQAKRLGKVVLASQTTLRAWLSSGEEVELVW